MDETPVPAATETQTLSLAHECTLVVARQPAGDVLRIVGPDGRNSLTILLTPAGPVLQFDGSLMLQASGELALSAGRLALHGREGIAITSDGDVTVQTPGDLSTTARIQNITAELGNVNIKANDDVRMNGERIKMNC
ncbi:MAG TPA: hypothetical protein VEL76_32370 [Gemmataceae bacterium]|nr:hypothetical protein [Gemmataceae bacterium]